MSRGNYLFDDMDWRSVEETKQANLFDEIDSIAGNRLLNTSVDDLCQYFVAKYEFEAPKLDESAILADQREATIDVSKDRGRDIRDRTRPYYITGTSVVLDIPFSGDDMGFRIRPTTYTSAPPDGELRGNTLILTVTGTNLNPGEVRTRIDRTLGEIRRYLGWLREDAKEFNQRLTNLARDRIEGRRQKLLADQNLVASLGFPLRARPDAPQTFTAPDVRRRIRPIMPQASTVPYQPEPVLEMNEYEHILSVMNGMVMVMERSPSAFASMGEEALRSHFLVQLNGQYFGQATGETFNYEGKTDILIRVNGKNIFIAECKYWDGPKKLAETIDQLLGYTSWRDTKVAIVIFNRNKKFSQVLDAIPDIMSKHSNFKKDLGRPSETSFRYVFAHRDDPNREMTLTVSAFDVPQAEAV